MAINLWLGVYNLCARMYAYMYIRIENYCLYLQGNVSEKELQRRPVELYMCSVLKRQGYGEGKPLLVIFLAYIR